MNKKYFHRHTFCEACKNETTGLRRYRTKTGELICKDCKKVLDTIKYIIKKRRT